MRNEMNIDDFVTHNFDGLDKVNESITALHSGDCLRAVVEINKYNLQSTAPKFTQSSNIKCHGGYLKQIKHESRVNNCEMTFSIWMPTPAGRYSPPPAVFYFLSGLTSTDENARTKANIMENASRYNMAVVFPDTSARGVEIEGQDDDWAFGSGAGFYLNATVEKWKKHYQMHDYIIKELPEFIGSIFCVDPKKKCVSGHSMGGHGAMSLTLRNPGHFQSASAFAPIYNPT